MFLPLHHESFAQRGCREADRWAGGLQCADRRAMEELGGGDQHAIACGTRAPSRGAAASPVADRSGWRIFMARPRDGCAFAKHPAEVFGPRL